MTAVDTWALGALSVAGSAIAIRARMLRPKHEAWTAAPSPVWLSLAVLALGLLMAGCTILSGNHASQREAMVYTLLAGVSLVMLWNLNRNGRREMVARQNFAREAAMAFECSGEPRPYPWERAD